MDCPICIESQESNIILNCSHLICSTCYDLHIKTSNVCPICRDCINKDHSKLIDSSLEDINDKLTDIGNILHKLVTVKTWKSYVKENEVSIDFIKNTLKNTLKMFIDIGISIPPEYVEFDDVEYDIDLHILQSTENDFFYRNLMRIVNDINHN